MNSFLFKQIDKDDFNIYPFIFYKRKDLDYFSSYNYVDNCIRSKEKYKFNNEMKNDLISYVVYIYYAVQIKQDKKEDNLGKSKKIVKTSLQYTKTSFHFFKY